MGSYPGNRGPLPAKDFCNSWGEGNPVLGKGALGNPDKQRMYYTVVGDRERQVKTVQTMLSELGFDIGSSGPDGKYGAMTEKAVMGFQQDNKDWDGNQLKVDGLVGPETADALNRKMVEKGWYDYFETDCKLTKNFELLTVTADALVQPISIKICGKQKAKIILVGKIPEEKEEIWIRLHNSDIEPILEEVPYRLTLNGQIINAKWEAGGWVKADYPQNQCVAGRIEWGEPFDDGTFPFTLDLELNCQEGEEKEQAIARLHNIGYTGGESEYEENVIKFQQDFDIRDEHGLLMPSGRLPEKTKDTLWAIYEEKDCNASRPHES